jgi:hypothetical protein
MLYVSCSPEMGNSGSKSEKHWHNKFDRPSTTAIEIN